MDNLATHSRGAVYERFEPSEARCILRRLEFHYTPKHASWLNMAEIEIGILERQCTDRRMPNETVLQAEVAAWQNRRNQTRAGIEWTFTAQDADEKLSLHYVS